MLWGESNLQFIRDRHQEACPNSIVRYDVHTSTAQLNPSGGLTVPWYMAFTTSVSTYFVTSLTSLTVSLKRDAVKAGC